MKNKQKFNSKLTQLVQELKSDSESNFRKAISELASIGDLSVIPDLFLLLKEKSNSFRQKMISNLLSEIQISDAAQIFIDSLRNEENPDVQKLILPVIWESKLDFSEFLPDIVEIAVSSDYLIALDCLTIIENMPGPFSESQLLEAQLHLKEFVEKKDDSDNRKNQILSEIALFIKDQNEDIDADLLFE